MSDHFQLVSKFKPAGDQPTAIAQLCEGLEAGLAQQTLLGATGLLSLYALAGLDDTSGGVIGQEFSKWKLFSFN